MTDLGITGNIIASILYDAATGIYQGFNDPLKKALNDTSVHFSKERNVEFRTNSLLKILEGKVAAQEVEKFKIGKDFIDEDSLALKFAESGDLYFEDESETLGIAQEILGHFMKRFEHHLLADSKTGLATLLSYIKIYGQSTHTEHSQIKGILETMQRQMEAIMNKQDNLEKLQTIQEQVASLNRQTQNSGKDYKILAWQRQIQTLQKRVNDLIPVLEGIDMLTASATYKNVELQIERYSEEIDRLKEKLESLTE